MTTSSDLATDRGHLYGDALFETIRVESGHVRWLELHIARLRGSADALGFPADQVSRAVEVLRECVSERDGLWRVTMSRDGAAPFGGGGAITRRHRPLREATPPRLVALRGYIFDGDTLSEHKTANYLHNIRARTRAQEMGYDDALMLTPGGRLGEATAANVWVAWGEGRIATPRIDGILPGVTRQGLLRCAEREGVEVEVTELFEHHLMSCTEVLLTSAGIGVVSAASLGERELIEDEWGRRFKRWLRQAREDEHG